MIFMEYCSHGTIEEVAKQGLTEVFIRRYTKDVLKAIDFLHERNVIHRDIKGFSACVLVCLLVCWFVCLCVSCFVMWPWLIKTWLGGPSTWPQDQGLKLQSQEFDLVASHPHGQRLKPQTKGLDPQSREIDLNANDTVPKTWSQGLELDCQSHKLHLKAKELPLGPNIDLNSKNLNSTSSHITQSVHLSGLVNVEGRRQKVVVWCTIHVAVTFVAVKCVLKRKSAWHAYRSNENNVAHAKHWYYGQILTKYCGRLSKLLIRFF